MSPSVFLPTMEEGNNVYKGWFRRICGATGEFPGPASMTPGPGTRLCGDEFSAQSGEAENMQLIARAFCPSRFYNSFASPKGRGSVKEPDINSTRTQSKPPFCFRTRGTSAEHSLAGNERDCPGLFKLRKSIPDVQ